MNALGRHEIIPIPFNQAEDCDPDESVVRAGSRMREPSRFSMGQSYTYGYTVQTAGS